MPLYETACTAPSCPMCGHVVEHYYPRSDSPMVACEGCGGVTQQILSHFSTAFSGDITSRYNDRDKDNAHDDGFWAWRRKTADGKPKAEYIQTWQQQREFCKAEGLARPQELPKNALVSEDGKSISTRGMPGQEI